MSGSKSVSSSPLEKLNPTNGANAVGSLDLPQSYIFKDQKSRLSFDNRLMGRETIADLSSAPWKAEFGSHSDISVKAAALFSERNPNGFHYENGHFSNSLFEMFDKKCEF